MSTPHPSFDVREPISGYVTRELIGRGGFGEVWKAQAPGGLEKAIKIVHAGIDSDRAERELRALQRIKDVRHPLILSIERIEIIDGTLVIVTELADSSLKDLYASSRAKGLSGIPRDKLLVLMRDAADALDFIYEEHSLQHLDIKPENLLIVGNRLKLGDFGLLKNIYERGASLVSGLTPTYAPPELFEGKPTRQSDQYSLSIVYQHMLTGELPFDGATSAQLAREHLSGVPRLTLLSRSERPVVARALSKIPAERFESCAAFVAALSSATPDPSTDDPDDEPGPATQTQTVSVPVPPPGIRRDVEERVLGDVPLSSPGIAAGDLCLDPVLSAIEVELQATRRASDTTTRPSEAIPRSGFFPTVFIGIGGTGGRVLQQLQRRINDGFGSLKDLPSLQMVLLDTDGKQLNSLMQDNDAWADADVVALPLRRPQDYRFRETELSKWLHRRWLYNMPRSLLTEGYRPLGRLAFVDHGRRVLISIRSALNKAMSADNVAKTAAVSGLPFRPGHARVVIVASISGGTGSGIVLDLAYAVRSELKRRSCSDDDVLAFLLHSTSGIPAERGKAVANAYATLSELGHYSSPGRFYPGERAVETASFHGDNRTFGGAYLLNLGEQLDSQNWNAATAQVAEFLYSTTATPARMSIDAARHADEARTPATGSTMMLRSLHVRRLDRSDSFEVADCIQQACRDVVKLWESGQVPAPVVAPRIQPLELNSDSIDLLAGELASHDVAEEVDPVETIALQWLADSGLEADSLRVRARQVVEQVWGCTERDYLQKAFSQLCAANNFHRIPRAQLMTSTRRLMDCILEDAAPPEHMDSEPVSFRDQLRDSLATQAAELGRDLVARITGLVDDPDGGVKPARVSADNVANQLKSLRNTLEQQRRAAEESMSEQMLQLSQAPAPDDRPRRGLFRWLRHPDEQPSALDELVTYAGYRLEEVKLAALEKFLEVVESQISLASDQLNHLARDLNCLSEEFRSPPWDGAAAETDGGHRAAAREYRKRIRDALQHDRETIARSVRDEFQRSVLAGDQKLRRFLGAHSELQRSLVSPLRNVAQQIVFAHVRQTTERLIQESACQAGDAKETLCSRLVSEFVAEHKSPHSGPERLVVLAPDTLDPRQFENAFASCSTAIMVPARTNGITICLEGDARPLEDVADELVEGNDIYRQLADKLHTRQDVDWRPLAPGTGKGDSGSDARPAPMKCDAGGR